MQSCAKSEQLLRIDIVVALFVALIVAQRATMCSSVCGVIVLRLLTNTHRQEHSNAHQFVSGRKARSPASPAVRRPSCPRLCSCTGSQPEANKEPHDEAPETD